MIQKDLINNNVVTMEHFYLATKFYGPDVGGIKGKTTINRPSPVVRNIVEMRNELMEVY